MRARSFGALVMICLSLSAFWFVRGTGDARIFGSVVLEVVDEKGYPLQGGCFSFERKFKVEGGGTLGACDNTLTSVSFSSTLEDTDSYAGRIELALLPDEWAIRTVLSPAGAVRLVSPISGEYELTPEQLIESSETGVPVILTFTYDISGNADEGSSRQSVDSLPSDEKEAQVAEMEAKIAALEARVESLESIPWGEQFDSLPMPIDPFTDLPVAQGTIHFNGELPEGKTFTILCRVYNPEVFPYPERVRLECGWLSGRHPEIFMF